MNISLEFAEIIGAHIGDGTLYKTNSNSIVWEIRGSLEEKEYYEHLKELILKIYNIKVIPKFRSGGKNGCWGIQTSKKEITSSFLNMNFLPETKTYTIAVPHYILNSEINIKRAFVRGLFDTDGCIRFDKFKKKKEYVFPRIEFTFASSPLRDSLKILLESMKFNKISIWGKEKTFHLSCSGKEMTKKWFLEIKPKNSKHLKKYAYWLINKQYNKELCNATVAQPGTALTQKQQAIVT